MPRFYQKSYVIEEIYDDLIQKPQLSRLPKNMTSLNTVTVSAKKLRYTKSEKLIKKMQKTIFNAKC
jgi:hypothetical protein